MVSEPRAGPESDEQEDSPPPRLLDHLKSSASGLIAGASDVDPTTVATMAVIGATTVYGIPVASRWRSITPLLSKCGTPVLRFALATELKTKCST